MTPIQVQAWLFAILTIANCIVLTVNSLALTAMAWAMHRLFKELK